MKATLVATLVLATAAAYAGAQAGGPSVDVAITVTGNPSLPVGFNAGFTVMVSNPGSQPLAPTDAASVGITLTTAFSQITGTGPGWACHSLNEDPASIVCNRTGALAPGQTYPPISVSAHANAPGSYQNCAHLSYLPGPSRPKEQALGNNQSCFNFVVQNPVQSCLTTNNGPRFITGTGTATSQAPAMSFAQNNWSTMAAQAGGPSYGNPNHAAQVHTNCTQASGTPFQQGAYTCTYTAQPCP